MAHDGNPTEFSDLLPFPGGKAAKGARDNTLWKIIYWSEPFYPPLPEERQLAVLFWFNSLQFKCAVKVLWLSAVAIAPRAELESKGTWCQIGDQHR